MYDGFYKNCFYNGFYENCSYNGFSYDLLVCDSFFMYIVAFLVLKRYVYFWDKCDFLQVYFFNVILSVIIFLVWKGLMGIVGCMDKNF